MEIIRFEVINNFWWWWICSFLIVVMVSQVYTYVKTHQIVHFKYVYYALYQLYLNKTVNIFLTHLWNDLSSWVEFTRSVLSDSLQPHAPQHARPPCPSPTPGVHTNPCPLNWWCHPTISSCHPLLLLLSIFPSIRVFSKWVNSSHEMAKVLEFQLQHQSFQWTPRTDLL